MLALYGILMITGVQESLHRQVVFIIHRSTSRSYLLRLQDMLKAILVGLTLKQRLSVMIIMLLEIMVRNLMLFQWVRMHTDMPEVMVIQVGWHLKLIFMLLVLPIQFL